MDENQETRIMERILKKLRGENERRHISYASITAAVSIVALLGSVGTLALNAGEQKERISNTERRQTEDRKLTKESLDKIEQKVDRTDGNVVKILIQLQKLETTIQRQERGAR